MVRSPPLSRVLCNGSFFEVPSSFLFVEVTVFLPTFLSSTISFAWRSDVFFWRPSTSPKIFLRFFGYHVFFWVNFSPGKPSYFPWDGCFFSHSFFVFFFFLPVPCAPPPQTLVPQYTKNVPPDFFSFHPTIFSGSVDPSHFLVRQKPFGMCD